MEYRLETESSAESVLLAQEQSPSPAPPPPYTISRHDINLEQVVQQQQEQLVVLQAIIAQAGLGEAEEAAVFVRPNTQVEVVRPQEFNGSSRKVAGFITVCKLYICMKMRGVTVEEQIQ